MQYILRTRLHALQFLIPLMIVLMLASTGLSYAAITDDEQKILSQISIREMMTTIEHLCSDQYRGRKAGCPNHYAAGDYLVSQLTERGLQALESDGMEGYKQAFTMRYALVRSKNDIKATLSYKAGNANRVRSFRYRNYNGQGGLDLNTDVVFVGYGIHDPSIGHDDYAGLDVSGKIVMWLPGQPKGITSKAASGSHKMLTAYQQGAVGCILYKPAGSKDEWGTNIGLAGAIADFPYLAVDDSVASELISPIAANIKTLMSKAPGKMPVGARGASVRLQVTPVCDPNRKTYNVIGVMPGSDPEVADEVVLMGAHYDHIGDTPDGKIFFGADDNASGTSVVLETARAIREAGLAPRRTIVFALWSGEEAGLLGSNHFAANPPIPLKEIVSVYNLDMVGAGNPGQFMTTGKSAFPDQYRHLGDSGRDLGYDLKPDIIPGASDHLAFSRKKVPSMFIHSAGEHPNYHAVTDTPDAINREVLESSARLAALAVWRSAN